MGILYQIIGTAIICTLAIDAGIIFSWPATTISLFESQNTTLNRPMTETEISLLGSLSSIGALLSTFLGGFLLDKVGRKKSSIILSLSMVLFWAIVTFTRQVEVILMAIFLSGVSSSIILTSSVYITEICQESIRGAMTAANVVSYTLGMLITYIIGGYLPYHIVLYIGLTHSVLRAGLLFILKDSPMFLMQNGREKEAAQAICFFRHLKSSDKEILKELNAIRYALNPELDESTPETEKLQKDLAPAAKLSFWQFMKKSKSTQRALIVTMVATTSSILQGFVVVQMYIEVMFIQEIPSISPTVGSVVMAAISVISGIVAGYLTDMAGRRFLMVYSSFGTGISCILLGTQMQLHWGPSWITAIFIYMYTVMYMIGAGTVPFVLLAEVFLPEVKSIISMIIIEWIWLCNFVVLFICNPLVKALGWGPLCYIFSAICFFSTVFCAIFLPETKGLTVNEIQLSFTKKHHRDKY